MDPVLIALGLGAVLFIFSGKKKKSTAPPVDGGGEDPTPGGGDQPGGGDSGGNGAGTAPPFPGTRITSENSYIDAVYSEWIAMLGTVLDDRGSSGPANMDDFRIVKANLNIPTGRTPGSWYADQGMKAVYNMSQKLGTTPSWKQWRDAWTRMYNRFRSKPLDPTA